MINVAPVTRDPRIAILAFAGCFFAFNLYAQNPADLISQGDQFAKSFDNPRALESYVKAYRADTLNCAAMWKIAEAYINVGEDADENVQKQYYYLAERWARRAAVACPDTANSHFFIAVSSGLLALHEGGKQKIKRSKEVKAEAEKTLALDPNHHGAYHALGRWNRELADLSWFLKAAAKIVYGGVPTGASFEAAVANFQKAIAISPNWIAHHKELGITYMKMKKWDLARQEFERALELPIADHQDEWHKKECQKFLKSITGKH